MQVYNKIFTKILDSSIWLEPDATRLVWLTLLASMDQDGFAQFASAANLAHRARVSLAACRRAVEGLEGDDPDSSDPDNNGRRIARVPGGWIVLNAAKYRELVTRVVARERTRERVRRFRERSGNADVTPVNEPVTPSEADTEAEAREHLDRFERFWAEYPRKVAKDAARKEWLKRSPDAALTAAIIAKVREHRASAQWLKDGGEFIPHARTWLHQKRWEDEATPAKRPAGGYVPRAAWECPHAESCGSPANCATLLELDPQGARYPLKLVNKA